MKWEIIIVTQPSRYEFLSQLLAQLEPQICDLGLRKFDQVDIRIDASDLNLPIGDRRELVRKRATGEYICFIDDDDLISPSYVSQILPQLDGIDQVGFEVKCFCDHNLLGTASHSLQHKTWSQSNGRVGENMKFCRDISHLNPMRRELALQAPMGGGVGEDCRWANDMRQKGIVKTEHFIPEILYWYLWRGQKNDQKDAHDPWRMQILEQLNAQAKAS